VFTVVGENENDASAGAVVSPSAIAIGGGNCIVATIAIATTKRTPVPGRDLRLLLRIWCPTSLSRCEIVAVPACYGASPYPVVTPTCSYS
jgi:hypothetical protein